MEQILKKPQGITVLDMDRPCHEFAQLVKGFKIETGKLYREPTLLYNADYSRTVVAMGRKVIAYRESH